MLGYWDGVEEGLAVSFLRCWDTWMGWRAGEVEARGVVREVLAP